jgi:outer membrane immunogenic protein
MGLGIMRTAFGAMAAVLATATIISTAVHAGERPATASLHKNAPAAATNWTGFYVNAGLGYGFWSADTTTHNANPAQLSLGVDQIQGGRGWLGIVGVGYDRRFTPNIVAGAFADFDLTSLKGTIQDQDPFIAGEIKQQTAWAAGVRAGWLFTPDFLGYVNGGYTRARFSGADMVDTHFGLNRSFTTPAFTAPGWFVGGGTETALTPGWFWRNEYRYASYKNEAIPDRSPGLADINFRAAVQTVTTQLIYKLNTGGPSFQVPAPMMPVNWSGIYVNGGFGYGGWTADTTTRDVPVCHLCIVQVQGGKGWLGVAGAGYDYQVTPTIVAGAFGDIDLSSLKGTIQDQGAFFAGDIKQTSAWAIGGRLGWLVTPRVLGYGNAGISRAHFSGTDMLDTRDGTPSGSSTPSFTAHGKFIGGGVEVAVTPNLFWRNEYRLTRYNNETLPDTDGTIPHASITFQPTTQTVTTQFVYKFNTLH